MCLYTNWRNPRIAKKDIVVYKWMRHEPIFAKRKSKDGKYKQIGYKIVSPIQTCAEWEIDKIYHASTIRLNIIPTRMGVGAIIGSGSVLEGLHANIIIFPIELNNTYALYKAIIPQGTEYVKGTDNDIVALEMKLIGKVYV